MKIEKRTYKVFYKGRKYKLPISVSVDVVAREKVLVPRKNPLLSFPKS